MKETGGTGGDRWLDQHLKTYAKQDVYPFHMPGHKRRAEAGAPYDIDITEIPGFDNLHEPKEEIAFLEKEIAGLYRCTAAKILVNGSTAGNLAGIFALSQEGEEVLLSRSCHKSVYHAILLRGLIPHYLLPEKNGIITPEAVRDGLSRWPNSRLVVLTSPTYEGEVCDISAIAEIVHKGGRKLFVDEAHGAHFGLHPAFPKNAISLGADLAVISLHKTLPALTQTAVLLCSQVPDRLQEYLAMFQSSSPSYVLMASISRCVRYLKLQGDEAFEIYARRLFSFYEKTKTLKHLKVRSASDPAEDAREAGRNKLLRDPSKIVIQTSKTSLSGPQLAHLLRSRYGIETEMASYTYVLAMTAVADTKEGFDRLADALFEIDGQIGKDGIWEDFSIRTDGAIDPSRAENTKLTPELFLPEISLPERVMEMQEADRYPRKSIPLRDAAGCVSGGFVSIYPPGIPLIVPGEVIPGSLPEEVERAKQAGLVVTGLAAEGEELLLWII